MNKKISIGKIIGTSNNKITVSISDEYDRGYVFIDGQQIKIGGVSNLIAVNDHVYEITQEKSGLLNSETQNPGSKREIQASLLGYFCDNSFFPGSNGETPAIFDNAYNLTDEEYNVYYSGKKSSNVIQIGKHLFHDTRFEINVDDFFASHVLICGNTGSGKSNTINRIFTELFSNYETHKSFFLFIDTNGEYIDAFTNEKKIITLNTRNKKSNTFAIPVQLLEPEDWKTLLEATEKTQFPIIKKVVNGLKRNVFESAKNPYTYIKECLLDSFEAILKSSNNSSVRLNGLKGLLNDIDMDSAPYSDWLTLINIANKYTVSYQCIVLKSHLTSTRSEDETDLLLSELEKEMNSYTGTKMSFACADLLLLMRLEHYNRVYKWNTNENNTSPMLARFASHLNELEALIQEYSGTHTPGTLKDTVFKNSNIVLCDVKNARKDIKRIMVAFLCKKLYLSFQKNDSDESLHIIIDEAHNYLSELNLKDEDAVSTETIDTFEMIIKEGRKFGVFLCMSTQRPNEISQTLLSQSHNYIIHKLVNPNDIAIINKTVSFIDVRSIESISTLSPGQAIFTGTAFNRPALVVVDYDPKYPTVVHSETIKLTDNWKKCANHRHSQK